MKFELSDMNSFKERKEKNGEMGVNKIFILLGFSVPLTCGFTVWHCLSNCHLPHWPYVNVYLFIEMFAGITQQVNYIILYNVWKERC